MKKIRLLLAVLLISLIGIGSLSPVFAEPTELIIEKGKFDNELEKSVQGIKKQIMSNIVDNKNTKAEGVIMYVDQILSALRPVIIAIGITIAMFGAYIIMSSDKEDKLKEGGRLVIGGVVGIIIMVSANFITSALINDVIGTNINGDWLHGLKMAESLYENIALPFIKLAVYLVVGILFFILAARVFTFLTSNDEGIRKKAAGMIGRTVGGILIIMAAKQLVEAVFGKRREVFTENADTVGEVGSSIFASQTIPILYQAINRIMGLATLAVLIIIIFQTFQLLTKPDDAEVIKKIKKTILYVAIGVVVIGAGYVISNVLLIN